MRRGLGAPFTGEHTAAGEGLHEQRGQPPGPSPYRGDPYRRPLAPAPHPHLGGLRPSSGGLELGAAGRGLSRGAVPWLLSATRESGKVNIWLPNLLSGGSNGEGVGISVRFINKQGLLLYLFLVGGLRIFFLFFLVLLYLVQFFYNIHLSRLSLKKYNRCHFKIPCKVVGAYLWKGLSCHHQSKKCRRNC